MDNPNLLSYTLYWRQLYQHKQQWYRHVLSLIMNYHSCILIPHFLMDWAVTALIFGPSPSRPLFLHLLAILLSLVARVTWIFLFRDPSQFVGLKRPGVKYRWTVLAACGATTVPNFVVHAVIMGRNFPGLREEAARLMAAKVGIVVSLMQIGLWGGAGGLCVWMVWRFLEDSEDEMYEPCVKSELNRRGLRGAARDSETGLEPYSDTPHSFVSHGQPTAAVGLLANAYAKQRREQSTAGQEPERNQQRILSHNSITEQEHVEGASENQNISISATSISAEDNSLTPLRCPTVARYDYMDKNHTGAHSWLFYPLIPAFLFAYSSIIAIPMIIFINQTKYLETSSPKAKNSLFYTLLGSYLLCFYALKHRLRRSMFEKFELPLPDQWIQVPSIILRRKRFKRYYAEPSVMLDPRLRALPPTAQLNPAVIRTKEYMQAYNAHPSSCSRYWGHQGRLWRSRSRTKPTLLRVGFIGLAALLYLHGYRSIFSYPLGADIGGSDESRRRMDRIRYSKILLQTYVGPQMIFIVMYTLASVGSMLKLWLECIQRFMEIEKQGRYDTNNGYVRGAVPSVGQRSDQAERPRRSG